MLLMAAATSGCAQIVVGTPPEIEPILNVALSAAEYRQHNEHWPESLEELCLSTVIILSTWSGSPTAEHETPEAERCRQRPYSEIAGLRLEHSDEALMLYFSPVQFQGKLIASARVHGRDRAYKVHFGE